MLIPIPYNPIPYKRKFMLPISVKCIPRTLIQRYCIARLLVYAIYIQNPSLAIKKTLTKEKCLQKREYS